MLKGLVVLMLPLFLMACECKKDDPECNAKISGKPVQISDADGIKLFKVWRDYQWIYYSADASKVTWTETYQCGVNMIPIQVGNITTYSQQPIYCDRQRETLRGQQ